MISIPAHIKVRIRWYSEDEGGYVRIPKGKLTPYVFRFADENLGAWSIVIHNPEEVETSNPTYQEAGIGFVRFEIVSTWLQTGAKFFIARGRQRDIAEGEIIEIIDTPDKL